MATGKLRNLFAGLAGVALALAACSPNGSGNPEGSGSGSTGPNGGTFVVARTGDIDKLDPHLATAFQTVETLGLIYDQLVRVDNSGHLSPDLATKWDVSPDGKTVTFTLRQNVTWQDGDPFTSADVKATIERILDEKTAAVARSNLTMISGVDTPNDTTVVLHLSQPSQALLYALASVNASILHAKDITADTVGKKPDGTGAFAFKSWEQGQSVTLTANAKYFDGAPAIKTLEFRVIPTESSILSGMKAHAFQMGIISDPGVADQASGGSGFELVKQPALSYHVLMLNGRRGPLKDQRVRNAIACAVDRQQVIDTAAFGDGQVTGPITSPAFQYSPTDGLPCTPGDVDGAKKLMADAGYADGVTLNTIVETGEYATSVGEGQNLQSQLEKIGVHLDLHQLTTTPYVNAWLGADFDAAVALNGGSYDPYLMYGRYFVTGGSLATPAGLASPKLSQLLTQANTTTDQAERHDLYGQVQHELLAESPWVWMFRSDDYYLVSSSVQGFQARPDEQLTSLASVSSY
ncbi:MAG TPA: ABC transporter substrate-binding protein [Jatrophihabitans sp.]|jgi:peptide/nickel transport system substrate-binding protein|nr:ABC transporter substrate-binding protein [Jatrophihabitans sp.]